MKVLSQSGQREGASISKVLKVGVAQMCSGPDPWENLLLVDAWVRTAMDLGVDLICFPENVFFRGLLKSEVRRECVLRRDSDATISRDSPFSETLADMATDWKLWVSLGSVIEASPQADTKPGFESSRVVPQKRDLNADISNCHWVLDPNGQVHGYDKIHLFEYRGEKVSVSERDEFRSGQKSQVVEIRGWKVGLSICYDLRFPELFRTLVLDQGAELLLVPSAFLEQTGRVHWYPLLQARAVENLSFVVAAGQWGEFDRGGGQRVSNYGHSLMIGPWGQILAEAEGRGDALLVSELNRDELFRRRQEFQVLQHAVLWK